MSTPVAVSSRTTNGLLPPVLRSRTATEEIWRSELLTVKASRTDMFPEIVLGELTQTSMYPTPATSPFAYVRLRMGVYCGRSCQPLPLFMSCAQSVSLTLGCRGTLALETYRESTEAKFTVGEGSTFLNTMW